VAQHRPTGSETTPLYAPRSSRFGLEPPSVEDDADVWRYAILELHARNDDDVVVNESEMLRWVTRQWQRLNGKDGEISGVGGML